MSLQPVLTFQAGARHNYAIPAAFADVDCLDTFYTDVCGIKGVGRLATLAEKVVRPGGQISGLANRKPPLNVAKHTVTFDLLALRLRRALRGASRATHMRVWEEAFEQYGHRMIKRGLGDAKIVYSVMHEAGPFMKHAKSAGAVVGADVCIAPSWNRLLCEEGKRFPEWATPHSTFEDVFGRQFVPYQYMLENADILVCPSEFVRRDLLENFGITADRTTLIPYSVGEEWFSLNCRPEPGRVLFAGSADLRKGIHYFASAATSLVRCGDQYRFIVAGEASDQVRARPEAQALSFLGRVPRSSVTQEFARADVLVLPSVAEGSAGVTYEALAAGVPVIASAAAGSVVRDGVDGFVLENPSADSLASAIDRIVSDRGLRSRMSEAARTHARSYTRPLYAERLRKAFC